MQNHFRKMLFTLALLALCAAGASRFATQPVAGQASTLHGAAALQQLKSDGGYASLAEALAEARAPLTPDALIAQQRKLTAADGEANDLFGTAVALSGDTAVIGAPQDGVAVSRQGSVWVFVRNGGGWSPLQKLTANDGATGDAFGISVALEGDTLVVGAIGDTVGANGQQGSAYVFTRSGTLWTQQQKLTAGDGAANDFFGFSVALSGDTVVAGALTDTIGANANQGSAYVFTRSGTTWTQQQKLSASEGAANAYFSSSIALNGDTVVVGAYGDTINANANQGSAYVFTRGIINGGTLWTQQQKLIANDGAANDQFGRSVGLSGDTVVVGAYGDAVGANQGQGSAYVFTRNGTAWTQLQQLTANDGAAFEHFGSAVVLSGDTLVVGASSDNIGSNANQGSAYVFSRGFANGAALWTQQRKLVAEDGAGGDQFGDVIALNSDTVVVGAYRADSGAHGDQGAAYVFVIHANNLVQQQSLTANDGAAGDQFGGSIALDGDTVVVGAPNDTSGVNVEQGSAYVFTRSFTPSGALWTLQQKLTASDGTLGDRFGYAVALDGDTVVVGADGNDVISGQIDQGSAYIFTRSGTVWTQQARLTANDGAELDYFGRAVALSGDTVVVGAPSDSIGTNADQGSAYVFTRSGTVWTQRQQLTANDGLAGDFFGGSVALSGDILVMGAQRDDISTKVDQGSAYVFTRGATAQAVWTQQQRLTALDGAANDSFGHSVALSGDTVVVGAAFDTIGTQTARGSVCVFIRRDGFWFQQQQLLADDGEAGDFFGVSVALSHDLLVVGAQGDDNGTNVNVNQGSAYVFSRNGTTWTQLPKLTAGDGAASDQFGHSVALSGDTVAVGAEGDTIGANVSQGSAYVFVCATCPTITLTPATLPNGVINTAYNQTVTASGGVFPYQFSLSAGALPPGLRLALNGVLLGTPTTPGTYRFTLTATSLSSLCPGSRDYTLTIGAQPGCEAQVSPAQQSVPSEGGSGVINVTVATGCAWTAQSNAAWLTITAGASGSGNGTVRFTAAANPSAARKATLTVAGRTVMVTQLAPLASVSAASYALGALASESIIAAFGNELATTVAVAATQPLPTSLGGTRVSVRDSQGAERFAPLFFVSPGQINFQMPPGAATGAALITVIVNGELAASSNQSIGMVAPGLFAANANGQGVPSALVLRIKADGSQSYEPVARFDGSRFVAQPINLGPATDRVFLVLFGTGLRYRSALSSVGVVIGGMNAETLYAGAQGSFIGLDQLNLAVPRALTGRGEIEIAVTADGKAANPLKVAIQ